MAGADAATALGSAHAARADRVSSLDELTPLGSLGSGGWSEVLLVRRSHGAGDADALYALKMVPRRPAHGSAEHEARLVESEDDEARILLSVAHRNIVALHATFRDADYCYMLLTYAGGGDLSVLLEAHGTLDEPVARFLVGQIVLALRYLHVHHRIIYRDLKPGNVLLSDTGHAMLVSSSSTQLLSECSPAMLPTSASPFASAALPCFLPPASLGH